MIQLSPIESKIYNLKVGRIDLNSINSSALLDEILFHQLDVCRVKINSENDDLITQLENLGLPYFLSGSLVRFKIDFRRHKVPPFRYNSEFELYDGSQRKDLEYLLANTFDEYPTTFYSIPYLNKIISKEEELKTLIEYFTETHKSSDRKIWLVKLNGKYGGLLAAKYWEDSCDAILAGVIPEFRHGALFLDIVRYIQKHCVDNKIPWGYTGARLHEVVSQKFFTRESMKVHKTELIFHVTSFLSKSVIPPITQTLSPALMSIEHIIAEVMKHSDGAKMKKQRFHWYDNSSFENTELKLSFPIMNNTETMIVAQVFSSTKLIGVGYFEFEK
jgi:hypothetical protein